METRYPFLDKKVVQEYLNLTPELKNKFHKSPITNFLITNKYPFIDNDKKLVQSLILSNSDLTIDFLHL